MYSNGVPYKHTLFRGEWWPNERVEKRLVCAVCGGRLVARWQEHSDPNRRWTVVCHADPEHRGYAWPPDPRIARIEKLYNGRENEMPVLDLVKVVKFQRLGKVRLGVKTPVIDKKTGKQKLDRNGKPAERPVPTDHFVVPPEIAAIYGPTPTALNVYFLFNSIDDVFPQFHKRYTFSALTCMGDGQRVVYALDDQGKRAVVRDGVHVETGEIVPCPGLAHDLYPKCEQCKPTGRLLFAVREIPRLGFWEMVTRKLGIININSQLRLAQALTGGRLTNVPFILRLVPEVHEVPMQDKDTGEERLQKKTLYIPTIEIDPEWLSMALPRLQARAEQEMLMLEAPRHDVAAPVAVEPEEVEDLDYEPVNGDDWEEDETPGQFICMKCGHALMPFTDRSGKAWTINGLIDYCNQNGRKPTCGHCLQEEETRPGNGNSASKNGATPNSPKALLTAANEQTGGYYKDLMHLLNTLKGAIEGFRNWPNANDAPGWAAALDAVVRHARVERGKVAAPAPATQQATLATQPASTATQPASTRSEDGEVEMLDRLLRCSISPSEFMTLIEFDDSYENWLLVSGFKKADRLADLSRACLKKYGEIPDWLRQETSPAQAQMAI